MILAMLTWVSPLIILSFLTKESISKITESTVALFDLLQPLNEDTQDKVFKLVTSPNFKKEECASSLYQAKQVRDYITPISVCIDLQTRWSQIEWRTIGRTKAISERCQRWWNCYHLFRYPEHSVWAIWKEEGSLGASLRRRRSQVGVEH